MCFHRLLVIIPTEMNPISIGSTDHGISATDFGAAQCFPTTPFHCDRTSIVVKLLRGCRLQQTNEDLKSKAVILKNCWVGSIKKRIYITVSDMGSPRVSTTLSLTALTASRKSMQRPCATNSQEILATTTR